MTISLNKLNSALSTVTGRLPVIDLNNAGKEVIDQNTSKQFSVLGASPGQVVGGVVGLTQEVDEGYEADVIEGIGLVGLTEDVPGFQPDLVGEVGEHASDIDLITGGSGGSKGGLKVEFFGGSGVEAIAALLALATGKDFNQLLGVLQLLTSPNLQSILKQALFTQISQTLAPIISQFNTQMNQAIGGAITSVLEDIADRVDGPIGNILQDLADGKLKVEDIQTLTQAISDKNYGFVINEIKKISTRPVDEIETTILGLSTSLQDRVGVLDPFESLPDFVVGSTASTWAGENTVIPGGQVLKAPSLDTQPLISGNPGAIGSSTYTFAPFASQEELEAELRSASREITETVVHWSAHYLDQFGVGARQLHQIALSRGFNGCSYHFVIRRDGTLERGRPINLKGAHAKANGHNNFSIGVAFVAGYNCLSGTPNPERYVGSESITAAQIETLDKYLECFYKVFPGGQVFGHNDTDPGRKPDPGFDVPQYVENKFGRANVNGGTASPLSPIQLAQARGTSSITATA